MQFRTPVSVSVPLRGVSHSDHILFLGSCFAEEVGKRFLRNAFDASVNPFGVMYNPASIASTLDLLCDRFEHGFRFTPSDLFLNQGLWRSWQASSLLAAPTQEQALLNLNAALDSVAARLPRLTLLVLTLGTNHAYYLHPDALRSLSSGAFPVSGASRPVANCHKMPSALFTEKELSSDSCATLLASAIARLRRLAPDLRVLLTVSPYRYAKYGFHRSALGKAVLLLCVDRLQSSSQGDVISYFPAFEILLDELRDYRFYAVDMLHPSPLAVDYIWERFVETCVVPSSRHFIESWSRVLARLRHRPFDGSPIVVDPRTERAILSLKAEYPFVSVDLLRLARHYAAHPE